MHELPLVFFTVFTQSAVGAFILLLIGGAMGLVAPRRKAIGLFSVMCLFGLGVIVGTFHVGQPLRALNMLLRVGHSPMSNEIVLSAAFAALAMTAVVVIAAELAGRIAFYNLWTLPM